MSMKLPMDGRNELHYAALDGDRTRVRALVAAGTAVDVVDGIGWTPLFFAVERGDGATTELLISLGADVNHADASGDTPLFRAIYASGVSASVATALLSAGADLDRPNRRGVTPRALVGRRGEDQYELVRLRLRIA